LNNEKHTRKVIIDILLKKVGWDVTDRTQVVEEYDIAVGLPLGFNKQRRKL